MVEGLIKVYGKESVPIEGLMSLGKKDLEESLQ